MEDHGVELYFFSGTGNSLHVAKRLASILGAGLASIPSRMDSAVIESHAEAIGIVYPCYLSQVSGVPNMVADFVRRLRIPEGAYLFAICTYGAFGPFNSVPARISLARIAREAGKDLSAHYSIKLPLNNLDYDHVPVPVSRDHGKMFAYTDAKLGKMASAIKGRRARRSRLALWLYKVATKPLFAIMAAFVVSALREQAGPEGRDETDFRKLMKLSDHGIAVDGNCTGCGTCSRVCPAGNIRMVEGRPSWLHGCEMCLACDEWCPKRAIHHWCKEKGRDYHHPGVTLGEIITYNERKGT